LLRQHQMAAVFVTHDREEALGFADRVAVMHEGRLAQLGPPEEIYCRPRTQYVARFIGQANLFPVSGNGKSGTCVFGEIPLDRETNDEAVAALRPEQITLEASSGGETAGTITGREFRGALVSYQVSFRESQFTVDLPAQDCFEAGDRVRLQAQSAAVVLEADE
jgi:iron(III) transport system ATP-binding protein